MQRWPRILATLSFAAILHGCALGREHLPVMNQSVYSPAQGAVAVPTLRHIYVGSTHQINEYPLTNWLPSAIPDRTLFTGIDTIDGLATDSSGALYVSGQKDTGHGAYELTNVYALGAGGHAHPERILRDDGQGIAVDSDGYIYDRDKIYSPHARRSDPPVQTLSVPWSPGQLGFVALYNRGHIAVDTASLDESKVYIFKDATIQPRLVGTLSCRWNRHSPWRSYAIAAGEDGATYVALSAQNHPSKILVFAPQARGCNPVRVITTTDEPLNSVLGIVRGGPYLYALSYNGKGMVEVLNPLHGAQVPVARIPVVHDQGFTLALGP